MTPLVIKHVQELTPHIDILLLKRVKKLLVVDVSESRHYVVSIVSLTPKSRVDAMRHLCPVNFFNVSVAIPDEV